MSYTMSYTMSYNMSYNMSTKAKAVKPTLRACIYGSPNAGKSTLLRSLLDLSYTPSAGVSAVS
eukprot:CAMPEP_0182474168 /NCGR_PEP_ID=MMETSP1319-20130603/25198_1 /TAXON_ID=172717 /ORGANISM="Bolidomonas pacifica, Strain RCC208" /LENGTH=62 /DNA_ID=CAMNT_0024675035 /DNA_START=261 /DNA_END=446 /DNA_ORIENTATION=-